MYALIILVVMVWLSTIVESQTIQNTELTSEYQNQTQGNQVRMLAENVRQFYQETHTFPVSISSLVQTPGFEHNRSQVNNWQNYAVSSPITDPSWQFKRAVLFSRKPTDGLSLTAYLSSNSCGTGSFNAAAGWCGMNTSYWWRYEDRELYVKEIHQQRIALNRNLQKIGDYFSAGGTFQSGGLISGDTYTLASLAGFTGTASTCSASYHWMGIPLDCSDLFDIWGHPIGLSFISAQHIALFAESPILTAAGSPLIIASDFNAQ